MRLSLCLSTALMILTASPHQLAAKEKHKQAATPPRDEIAVAGHIAIPGAPILRFVATKHYDRTYLYAERGAGQPITLLDITKPGQPVILSQLDSAPLAGLSGSMNLVAVAGTAAISSSAAPSGAAQPSTQTIRLMDFADPASPKVKQQFDGVTAVEEVAGGVVLLANPDGVWILTRHFAADPKEDERYARKVIYGESMY